MEVKMNILFYARKGVAESIQKLIEKASFEVEIHRTIRDLKERLRRPLSDRTIAILAAHTLEDLKELLVIRNLLSNVRIILVLPDRESETVAAGHNMHARFLTYLDGNPAEVVLVLNRMSEWAKAQESSQRAT